MKGNNKASDKMSGSGNGDSTNEKLKISKESPQRFPKSKSVGVTKKAEKKKGGGEERPLASITQQDLENEIQERAFYIYLQRGTEGDPLSDWLQAEAEIKRKYGLR